MPIPLICPTQNTPPSIGAANFQRVWWLFFSQISDWVNGDARNFVGTHAGRLNYFDPAAYPMGTTYYETDRTVTYTILPVNGVNVWRWTSGVYPAALASIPTGLTSNDTGFLFYVTDYDHTLKWTGTTWTYGNGDRAGYIQGFAVDPSPTTGWQLCDGTTVAYLKADGTTANYVTPNLTTTAAYLKLGTPVTGINAATAPTLTSPTGSFTGTPATLTGTIGGPSATVSVNVVAPTVSVGNGTHIHTLTMNSYTPAGSVALAGGSVAADGQPSNIVMRPWFRR